MLSELVVQGLGVIDRAELHLTPGASALTGETGAGKTLLVAALGLLTGGRGERSLVREGAVAARVQARFVVDEGHPAVDLLAHRGIEHLRGGDIDIVLERSVARDGKSKARINDRLVTLATLHEVGSELIEIAGQNEHHRLGDASIQRDLLDAFAGEAAGDLTAKVAAAFTKARALEEELQGLRASERERERELDVLRFEIAEIEKVRPRAGESEELTEAIGRLEHSGTITEAVGRAATALKGDAGAGEAIAVATRALEGIAELEPRVVALVERLSSLGIEVADVADELARIGTAADPDALAQARERLDALRRLARKYGPEDRDVLAYEERARVRMDELESAAAGEEELEAAFTVARDEVMAAASELSEARRQAAARLEREIEGLLAELALPGARLDVVLEPRELHAGGLESVSFAVTANPGEPARPISKVASGGELSRIALALRLVTSTGSATTMVFDEVDAGVGGEAARSVGRYLAELSHRAGVQVLVVTHLPQVAAFADHQYRVAKTSRRGRAEAEVALVQGDERVEELSRMLAGLPESDRAKQHAQELLDVALQESRS